MYKIFGKNISYDDVKSDLDLFRRGFVVITFLKD